MWEIQKYTFGCWPINQPPNIEQNQKSLKNGEKPNNIQFWVDGWPSNMYFWSSHTFLVHLTPLTSFGLSQKWFETRLKQLQCFDVYSSVDTQKVHTVNAADSNVRKYISSESMYALLCAVFVHCYSSNNNNLCLCLLYLV